MACTRAPIPAQRLKGHVLYLTVTAGSRAVCEELAVKEHVGLLWAVPIQVGILLEPAQGIAVRFPPDQMWPALMSAPNGASCRAISPMRQFKVGSFALNCKACTVRPTQPLPRSMILEMKATPISRW